MADTAPPTKPTTKWQIDRLDPRERRFSFVAAALSVAMGIGVYLIQSNNPKFRLAKGQITPQTTLILGLACGALLVITTLIGRRALVGFVALFTFLGFGTTGFALGAPFLVLAGWLLYRSWKFQKEAAARLREANGTSSSRPTTGRGAVAASAKATSTKSGSTKSAPARSQAKGPATPEANKRFTPKRPAPPPPKPSRRERKAAQASD